MFNSLNNLGLCSVLKIEFKIFFSVAHHENILIKSTEIQSYKTKSGGGSSKSENISDSSECFLCFCESNRHSVFVNEMCQSDIMGRVTVKCHKFMLSVC